MDQSSSTADSGNGCTGMLIALVAGTILWLSGCGILLAAARLMWK